MTAKHLAAGDAPTHLDFARTHRHPRHRAETAISTSPTVTGNPARTLELLSSTDRADGAAANPHAAAPTFLSIPAPRPATRHLNARSNA